MEKYVNIREIVKTSIDGMLEKLTMQYENDHDLHIELEYKDKSDYRYGYEMIINRDTMEVDFITHLLLNGLDHVTLKRNPSLEAGVLNYLFHKKEA